MPPNGAAGLLTNQQGSFTEFSIIEEQKSVYEQSPMPPPSKLQQDSKVTADFAKRSASVVGERSSETTNGELDPRLIYSDNYRYGAPSSDINSKTATTLKSAGTTKLGVSAIKLLDLAELVQHVFDEEYDPTNITRRTQAWQSRRTFDMETENLEMSTDLPCRLFEILNAFIASEERKKSHNSTPVEMSKERVLMPKPSAEARARMIDAIHSIEDFFVNYSSDIIERVIYDFKTQSD